MAQNTIVTWAQENTLLALVLLALIIWGVYMLFFRKNGTTRIIERDVIDEVPSTNVFNFRPSISTNGAGMGSTGNGGTSGGTMGAAGARVSSGKGGAL